MLLHDFNSANDDERRCGRRSFVIGAAATALSGWLSGSGCGKPRSSEGASAVDAQEASDVATVEAVVPHGRVPIPDVEPIVRVRIMTVRRSLVEEWEDSYSEDDRHSVPIRIGEKDQRLRLVQMGERSHVELAEGPITVWLDDRGWSIVDGHYFRAPFTGQDPVEIVPVNAGEESATMAIGDRRYGGRLRLVARTDLEPAALDIVNHIALEDYLPGVLARELFNHWHFQTHVAQAIAARSYACSEQAYFARRRHYDMTSTQRSQAYIGAVTHQVSLEAVARTRGYVLSEENLLVPGYYSSCCGGTAARAVDAIGTNPINDTPALHGRPGDCPCEKAPTYEWRIQRGREEITRRLIAFGNATRDRALQGLVTIHAIEAVEMNEHGRPAVYRVRDIRNQEVMMPAEKLRRAMNYAGQGLGRPRQPLLSGFFTVTVLSGSVIFRGRGHGHGAGLCQYGAEHLAQSGKEYWEILEFYYPSAEVVQAYA